MPLLQHKSAEARKTPEKKIWKSHWRNGTSSATRTTAGRCGTPYAFVDGWMRCGVCQHRRLRPTTATETNRYTDVDGQLDVLDEHPRVAITVSQNNERWLVQCINMLTSWTIIATVCQTRRRNKINAITFFDCVSVSAHQAMPSLVRQLIVARCWCVLTLTTTRHAIAWILEVSRDCATNEHICMYVQFGFLARRRHNILVYIFVFDTLIKTCQSKCLL